MPPTHEESSDEDPATLTHSVGQTKKLKCPEVDDDDEAIDGTTFQTSNKAGELFTINLLGRFGHLLPGRCPAEKKYWEGKY